MQPVLVGTAQWGLDYGVTNSFGRPSDAAVRAIADFALDHALAGLDTAPAYGDSEERIGSLGTSLPVQTKVTAGGRTAHQVRVAVEESLARLDRPRVRGILVHDWADLDDEERRNAADALDHAYEDGLAEEVGISIYSEHDLRAGLMGWPSMTVVQLPASVLDQRLARSDVVAEARAQGIRIQARSIFLQGVALGGPSPWSSHPDVQRLIDFAAAHDVDPMSACLSFVRHEEAIDEIVAGFAGPSELVEFWSRWSTAPDLPGIGGLASGDARLVDPRTWT